MCTDFSVNTRTDLSVQKNWVNVQGYVLTCASGDAHEFPLCVGIIEPRGFLVHDPDVHDGELKAAGSKAGRRGLQTKKRPRSLVGEKGLRVRKLIEGQSNGSVIDGE